MNTRPHLASLLLLAHWVGCADTDGGDQRMLDGGTPPDAANDSFDGRNQDAAPDAAANHVNAVPGKRCALPDRLGIIDVLTWDGQPIYASSSVFLQKDPALQGWKLQANDCRFHEGSRHGSPSAPTRPRDAKLMLAVDDKIQTFLPNALGEIGGVVTLPGRTFSAQFFLAGVTIDLPATTVPSSLSGLGSRFIGSARHQDLEIKWDVPGDDAQVHTVIPINHHAGGPTFTECMVDSAKARFAVPAAMLEPLAVVTGLEFQSVDHVRFAAAELPGGCVEFQFSTRFIGQPPIF